MAITERRMSLQAFLELPEEEPALEFDDGVVTQKVSPQGKHSILTYRLAERFNRFAEPRQLAFAFPELRTTFADFSPVPDIAIYRWERIPRDSDGTVANRFVEPPDLAIEIVSPQQSVTSLVRKCLRFVERGVPIVLLIDPGDESVLRFGPSADVQVLRGADPIDLSEVLPGFELTAQAVFDLLHL